MQKIKILFLESVKILKKAEISSADLDARLIFEFALNIKTEDFYKFDFSLTQFQKNIIKKLTLRRAKNEPVAYLTGHKEFYGLDFKIDKNVLIPRPESEELVELGLDRIMKNESRSMNIIDIGTGSGNIIISLIKSLASSPLPLTLSFYATDISIEAINIAKKNARYHNTKNIKFYKSDLLTSRRLPKKFDLIIANLPYVPLKAESIKQKAESIDFEPKDAIFAVNNGTDLMSKLLLQAKDRINIDGKIILELDPRNADQMENYAKKLGYKAVLKKDLAGLLRYLICN